MTVVLAPPNAALSLLLIVLQLFVTIRCDGIGVERARGGGRRERVVRACIDTGQPAVGGLLIVAGVTAIKQSLSLPKAD